MPSGTCSLLQLSAILGPEPIHSIVIAFAHNRSPQDRDFTEYCRRFTDLEFHAKFFNQPPYSAEMVKHLSTTMVDHMCDEDGKLLVSRVIRFEDRHKGLAEVAKKIGCPSLGSLHVQRTAEPDHDYRSHYTPETQKLIGDYYAKDVELLGYEF